MRPLDIIAEKLSTEGLDIPRGLLVQAARTRVTSGRDWVFAYGDLVFTVSKDPNWPSVHIYSLGVGTGLLKASRQFMDKVWERTGHERLLAPIKERRVMKLAERFGWHPVGHTRSGHTIYVIARPK